ncbi:transposase [Tenacibaculum sp. Bg11-29]
MHIEYRTYQNISTIVKKFLGRSSRKLQEEFLEFNKRYWEPFLGNIGFGR